MTETRRVYLQLMLLGVLSAPASTYAVAADDSDITLEEIIVTARSREESVQEVPDSIYVISESAIQSNGIDEFYDFVRVTPGLSIVESSQSPGIALLNIRGIGQQLNQEPPVAVVVDGVQTASPAAITQGFSNVVRIETVKGPQGALYGRNAIGGAINIITKAPTGQLSGYVKAGGGTHGSALAEAAIQGPLAADAVRFSLLGRYSNYDGDFRNGVLGLATNPLEESSVRGRLIFDLADNVDVDVRYNHDETTNAGYNPVVLPGGDAGDFSRSPMSGRLGNGRRTIDEASLKLSVETTAGTWTSTTAYVDTTDASDYELDAQPIQLIDLSLQRTDLEAVSEELRLTSHSEQRLRYTAGLYYLDTKLNRDTTVTLYPPVTGAPVPVSLPTSTVQDNTAWAAFGQANYDVTDALELTLAIRYDDDRREQTNALTGLSNEDDFDAWQPKISLGYSVSDAVLLYATYAEGFRSGGFNQPTPSFPIVYDEEGTQSYEAGVKSELLDRRLLLNAALFRTVLDDQQVTLVDVQNSGAQGIVNIDETRFSGAELEARALLTDSVQFNVGVSYVDSNIEGFAAAPQYVGNRSPYAPELTWTLGIDYTRDYANDWQLQAHLDYSGQSGMFYEYFGSIEQPAYGTTNLRARLSHGRFAIEAYGENVFDESYYSDVASNFVTGGLGDLGIRGRRDRLGVNVSFEF